MLCALQWNDLRRALAVLLCSATLSLGGCGGGAAQPENQVPDNPAPLPDPAERIEG